jgi:hypothetical protein
MSQGGCGNFPGCQKERSRRWNWISRSISPREILLLPFLRAAARIAARVLFSDARALRNSLMRLGWGSDASEKNCRRCFQGCHLSLPKRRVSRYDPIRRRLSNPWEGWCCGIPRFAKHAKDRAPGYACGKSVGGFSALGVGGASSAAAVIALRPSIWALRAACRSRRAGSKSAPSAATARVHNSLIFSSGDIAACRVAERAKTSYTVIDAPRKCHSTHEMGCYIAEHCTRLRHGRIYHEGRGLGHCVSHLRHLQSACASGNRQNRRTRPHRSRRVLPAKAETQRTQDRAQTLTTDLGGPTACEFLREIRCGRSR